MPTQITIPETAVEIARLTTRTGRVLMIAYCAADGTYGYRGDGCWGSGQPLARIAAALNEARDWPGGKTATFTATAGLFAGDPAYVSGGTGE